ncbi:hypothetical protein [Limnoglobus roseus]|uniref:hypothetical protein n=1 Tax=Limnoglobus roseus TaxID=2598579 RepID=UPI00143DBF10|nr:hypothetical protein [Limnoglobus roseus]
MQLVADRSQPPCGVGVEGQAGDGERVQVLHLRLDLIGDLLRDGTEVQRPPLLQAIAPLDHPTTVGAG